VVCLAVWTIVGREVENIDPADSNTKHVGNRSRPVLLKGSILRLHFPYQGTPKGVVKGTHTPERELDAGGRGPPQPRTPETADENQAYYPTLL